MKIRVIPGYPTINKWPYTEYYVPGGVEWNFSSNQGPLGSDGEGRFPLHSIRLPYTTSILAPLLYLGAVYKFVWWRSRMSQNSRAATYISATLVPL